MDNFPARRPGDQRARGSEGGRGAFDPQGEGEGGRAGADDTYFRSSREALLTAGAPAGAGGKKEKKKKLHDSCLLHMSFYC